MTTNHRPKYNHHHSGRAHFSQTGKVAPVVGRLACPLREINGHVFSVTLNDAGAFPLLRPKDVKHHREGKRAIVNFTSASMEKSWLTVVGCIFERDVYYRIHGRSGAWGQKRDDFTTWHYPNGIAKTVAILTDPREQLAKPASLLLELSLVPRELDGDGNSVFLFIGGFDSLNWREIQDSPGFLAIRYPATPDERDLSLIRSMDVSRL